MRLKLILFYLLILPGIAAGARGPLADNISPYLDMHADDPVQWRLWSDEVLQQARRENKLIFISVAISVVTGATSCSGKVSATKPLQHYSTK